MITVLHSLFPTLCIITPQKMLMPQALSDVVDGADNNIIAKGRQFRTYSSPRTPSLSSYSLNRGTCVDPSCYNGSQTRTTCSNVNQHSWGCYKFVEYCDLLHPYIKAIVNIHAVIHIFVDLAIGISTVVHWIPEWAMLQLFKTYYLKTHQLSPFVPVWYNIDEFPFHAMFTALTGFSFLNAVIYFVILSLDMYLDWTSFEKNTDERSLLIFVSLLMCQMKIFVIGFPNVYYRMILDTAVYLSLGKVMSEFQFLGNNSFTTYLNMIMLMGGCCGLTGPEDFGIHWGGNRTAFIRPESNPYHNISFMYVTRLPAWPNESMNVTFQIPAACCPQPLIEDPVDHNWTALRQCIAGQKEVPYHRHGCAETYTIYLNRHVLPFLFVDDIFTLVLLFLFAGVNGIRLYFTSIIRGVQRSLDDDELSVRGSESIWTFFFNAQSSPLPT